MSDYSGPRGDDIRELDALIGLLESQGDEREIFRSEDWDNVERALPFLRAHLLGYHFDPEILGLLREINRKLNLILKTQEIDDMATQQTLAALIASTTANTNATAAAKAALDHFAASQADLNAKLAAAIANSEASDDPAVQAAIDAINANNTALAAATPAVATAVTANTPAAAPAA